MLSKFAAITIDNPHEIEIEMAIRAWRNIRVLKARAIRGFGKSDWCQ